MPGGGVRREFEAHPVEAPEQLLVLLLGDRVGKAVTLKVLRGGDAKELTVVVGERPVQ